MSETVAHVLDTRYRTGDVEISENVDFEGLFLSKTILQGLNRAGFVRPSPIQLKAIPIGRCGLDLIIQAKSGTGKTCVFTVIALESVMPGNNRVQALVLAPTREIAFQNAHVVQSIGSSIAKLRSYAFTGGIPLAQDKLKLKCCHVATGTPGRIKQLIEEGTMVTDNIRLFVLDEADKLLEEGFQDTINWIYSHLPENKQIIAASATYTEDLAQFLMRYMRNPTFVRLNSNDPALLGVKQYYKVTPFHTFVQKVFEEKDAELFKLLNKISFNQCIIFSNYQARAQVLCDKLTSKGWPTMYISGSQDQQQRMHVMSTLQKFQCRILISTDLTSRGIDAEHVNLVLNLDVPWDKETYLHRIGRAGRFGTVGIAVTFASKGNEEEQLMKIKNDIGLQLIPLPDRIDNTIWQLDSPGQNLTVKSAQESLEKAPIAKEESTNPFENVSKSPSLEQCNEEEPPLQNTDFRRDKKRDSVISKSSNSTRNSTDSTSTDQSIHTVISRCQSLVGEDVNESESKDTIEEEIKPPLLSVISRCESTDEIVEETKKEGDEEEPYVPTSVKNRIHEFERYIVKLINAGDVVKSDPTTPTTPPTDAATKRSILKDLRDMSTVKGSNSSGEIDEFTKTITPKRLVKCETWDSHERERKGLTKSATVDVHLETEPAQPKTVDINFELPKPDIDLPKKTMYKSATFDLSSARVVQQISSLKRGKSESDVIVEEKTDDVKSAVEKCETTHSGEVRDNFDNGFNRSTLEIKLSDTKATNEPPLVTESYKDLEADLERFIDSTFSCGDNFSLEQAKNLDKVQDVKEIEIINEGSESGDDKIRVSKYAEECMKRICSLDFKPSDDVAEEWKKYQEHWEQFKDEIRSLESEEDQVVSSKKITTDKQDEDTKSIDKRECYVNTKFEIVDVQLIKPELETENETKIALQPTIIVDDGIEKLNKMDSCDFIQSDIVDRVTLLSKMTSEHEWIFSSSSIDAPDTENDEKENESDNDVMTSETDNKEENSTDADAKNESNGSGECILQEESVTTENETTEEDSSESNESEESESSEHAEGKEETGSTTTVENPPEGNQWTDYWKSFSDWASQMHKGPIIDSTKSQIGANQPFPSFPFPAPPFSPQMPPMTPMIPQMSSMWPQVQFPGAASPFNTCCNCSMASAWWNQYWSFYYWQMMMMHKSKEKKQ